MAVTARYLFIVSMDVDPDKEDLFNELYNKEHVPFLNQVPGVRALGRFERQDEVTVIISGQKHTIRPHDQPKYFALYELESPDALVSKEWTDAVDKGRWVTEARPYTSNRRQVLLKRIGSD